MEVQTYFPIASPIVLQESEMSLWGWGQERVGEVEGQADNGSTPSYRYCFLLLPVFNICDMDYSCPGVIRLSLWTYFDLQNL